MESLEKKRKIRNQDLVVQVLELMIEWILKKEESKLEHLQDLKLLRLMILTCQDQVLMNKMQKHLNLCLLKVK